MENPEALGFHQEQTETMEDSTGIPGLVLYQTLFFIYSVYFIQNFPKSKIRKEKKNKRKILITSFSYNTKIQIPSCYFNVSGNIIK